MIIKCTKCGQRVTILSAKAARCGCGYQVLDRYGDELPRARVVSMTRQDAYVNGGRDMIRPAMALLSSCVVIEFVSGKWQQAKIGPLQYHRVCALYPDLVIKGSNIKLRGGSRTKRIRHERAAVPKTTMSCAGCGKTISIRPEPYCVSCHNERKFAVGRTIILD